MRGLEGEGGGWAVPPAGFFNGADMTMSHLLSSFAPPSDARPARLAELERQIADGREAYERAKTVAASPEAQRTAQSACRAVMLLLQGFKAGDGGDKALYLLGAIGVIVAEAVAPDQTIIKHEALREAARRLREGIAGG